ncbi:hypothetical protein ACOME3_008178 [Neoechinorhynchus agilis]
MKNERASSRPRHTKLRSAYVIGVAGGSAAGKSTVVREIVDELKNRVMNGAKPCIVTIHMESFFNESTQVVPDYSSYGSNYLQFYPEYIDCVKLCDTIKRLKSRANDVVEIKGSPIRPQKQAINDKADIIIIEGTYVLYFPILRELLDLKIFVDCDADIRLITIVLTNTRRVLKYKEQRSLDQILDEHDDHVKPCHDNFCRPTKRFAEVVIPKGRENAAAISLLAGHFEKMFPA